MHDDICHGFTSVPAPDHGAPEVVKFQDVESVIAEANSGTEFLKAVDG